MYTTEQTKTTESISEKLLEIENNLACLDDFQGIDLLRSVLKKEIENAILLEDETATLNIGIVGQVKAGKSSFLNALIFEGREVLPKAATPMTAGLTVLRHTDNDKPYFEVEYYTKSDWEHIEIVGKRIEEEIQDYKKDTGNSKEEYFLKSADKISQAEYELYDFVKSGKASKDKIGHDKDVIICESDKALSQQLLEYVGSDGRYMPITKSLTIYLNHEALKGLSIVDTPGVNDPIKSREERTNEYLSKCHGVFFLSSASSFCDASDMQFLNDKIKEAGISEVVILASQFDNGLKDLKRAIQNGDIEDLEEAKDRILESNQETAEQALSNSGYKGNAPRVECLSGIAYAISAKSEDEWTKEEHNTVEFIKNLFPDDFSDIDTIQANMLELSNLETIREIIETDFLQRKEQIIQKRLSDFGKTCCGKLIPLFEGIIGKIKFEKDTFQNGNIKELEKAIDAIKKADVEKIVNKTLGDIIHLLQLSLKDELREYRNIEVSYEKITRPEKIKKDHWWNFLGFLTHDVGITIYNSPQV